MRLVSLNIWGGIVYEPLLAYIRKFASSTDVFCFQEVLNADWSGLVDYDHKHSDIHSKLAEILPDHVGYFGYARDKVYGDLKASVGNALFINKKLVVENHGTIFTYHAKSEDDPNHTQTLQYAVLSTPAGLLFIVHVHGIARPGTKLDTEDRLNQSAAIVDFLKLHPGRTVLCGDFNLLPQTESIQLIEQFGLKNLISEFKITTTRSELNYAKHPNDIQYFADYTFTSSDIKVINFKVPQINISDHLPMVLDFE